MEESDFLQRKFTVGVKQAYVFIRSLFVMKEMASSVSLIVKNAEIQVFATSTDRNVYASLEMEAYTASSWSSDCYAIQFDQSIWFQLLQRYRNQQNKTLQIFKLSGFPYLFCSIGSDRNPIRLGDAHFVQVNSIDMKNLESCHVRVQMTTQCLKEVIPAFSFRYPRVTMIAKDDMLYWITPTGRLTHSLENEDCYIEGLEPGITSVLLVEWREASILHKASFLSEEVEMSVFIDPEWMGWIYFRFEIGGENFFWFMMRGSDKQLNI